MTKLFWRVVLTSTFLLSSCNSGDDSDSSSKTSLPSADITKSITPNSEAKNVAGVDLNTISSGSVEKGLEHLEINDVSSAAKEFSKAYDNGDADGAFYLGRMSELGIGLKPDLSRAVALYKAGSEKGSPLAKNRLGLMHLSGQGALQDFELGAKLVCEAADKGDSNAQFNCGNLYLHCLLYTSPSPRDQRGSRMPSSA